MRFDQIGILLSVLSVSIGQIYFMFYCDFKFAILFWTESLICLIVFAIAIFGKKLGKNTICDFLFFSVISIGMNFPPHVYFVY